MQKIKRDLTGLRVFNWLVLKRNGVTPDGQMPLWLCRCDCGTERDIRAGNLRNNLTRSCGCGPKKPKVMRAKVEVGEVFGKLTVVERLPKSFLRCECACGAEATVLAGNLRGGGTQSCGCYRRETVGERSFQHGMIDHPAHRSWSGLLNRCRNSNDQDYHLYGGRGISFCPAWGDFNAFWADMGMTWFEGATIERKDGNGNYEPSNCEWITIQEQQMNRSNNVMIDTPFGVMPVAKYAKAIGLKGSAVQQRVRNGWTDGGKIRVLGTRAEIR